MRWLSLRGIKFSLLLLAIFVCGTTETAEACFCAGTVLNARDEAAEEFAAAAVVFEGEVLPGGHLVAAPHLPELGLGVIVLRVIRSYKGDTGQVIEIYDDMAGSDCEFGQPEPGSKFFIYGSKGKDGRIYVRSCERSGPDELAEADIRFARNEPATSEDLEPPAEKERLQSDPTLAVRGATLHGIVRPVAGESLRNLRVEVWTPDDCGVRQSSSGIQKVQADGTFDFRYLAPGVYVVTALDSGKSPVPRYRGESGTVLLGEDQISSSVTVTMHLEPVGTVRIRVAAPSELRARVTVSLRDHEANRVGGGPFPYIAAEVPDANNVALFEGVPYGMYDVDVQITGDDLNRPSWTYDDLQVQVSGALAEMVVQLREFPKP